MDKRTAVFVTLVLASFLCINLFFSYKRDQYSQALVQQKATETAQEAHRKKEVPISSLPVVDIFADHDQSRLIAKGIDVKGNTLTLAWNLPLPKTVYVNGIEQELLTTDPVKEGPILYGKPDFQELDLTILPKEGSYDLQLVTFSPGALVLSQPAEYRNGHFYAESVPTNGLALFKTPEGYLPLGFYESKGQVFVELQNLPVLNPFLKTKAVSETVEQSFYVLENKYQQLVFSNIGGALVEINLPFHTAQNQSSVVNEIGFDRELAKESPINSHFPAHPYYKAGSNVQEPPGQVGGYYPLLRRGIQNKKKIDISPQYYALNLVSDYPETAQLQYQVKEFTPERIVFQASQPHRRITKIYTLSKQAPYVFDLAIKIEGDSRGLWLTSGIPEVEIMSNNSSPQIQYRLSRKGKSEVNKLDLPKEDETVAISTVSPDWIVNSNGYLGIIMDPLQKVEAGYKATAIPGSAVPTRLAVIDPEYHPYPAAKYPGYEVLMPIPVQAGDIKLRIYAGPFEENTLKTVDRIYSDAETGYNPDYLACRTFYGWFSFISKPFAKFLYLVMKFFYSITGSWALSIILLTVFLRVLLYPLNAWSIKSMRRMQQISPQIQALQQKYKKDPKKAQIEIMNLYRQEKVNPFMGCIPILIQIPFLIAMFDLLKSSFQLRGASFIPGWIDNLTAPDVLFSWETPIFFIGNQFHLLPILLGIVMFFQQRISSTAPKDPKEMTDQQRQQKAMSTIMTVVFTVMFYHFPSGLNLYWLSSMLLGIGQQWMTNKWLNKKENAPVEKLATKNINSK